jgi:hypothetical protein
MTTAKTPFPKTVKETVLKQDVSFEEMQEATNKDQEATSPDLKEEMIPKSQVKDYIDKQLEEIRSSFTQAPARTELPTKKVESSDDLPEFENWVVKDRIYVLCTGHSSLSHGIKDRHKRNSPLMYKGRALRFSTSQASFFMDKQAGDVLLSYLSIDEGKLIVPQENTHLQKFLAIHPDNGIVFKEFDPEEESRKTYDAQNVKIDAYILSKKIDDFTRDSVAMLMCKGYTEKWEEYTIRKNLNNEIEANPKLFIKLAQDPALKHKTVGKISVLRGYLKYVNFKFLDENDQIICEPKMHENEYDALATYFLSNTGRSLFEYLRHKIEG